MPALDEYQEQAVRNGDLEIVGDSLRLTVQGEITLEILRALRNQSN